MTLPIVRSGRRLPADALESLIGLHRELTRVLSEQSATPEVARRANQQLRERMRERDNYFADIERAAAFYSALGWERCASGGDEITWFRTNGAYLGLFGYASLATDADLPPEPRAPFGGITLAINVEAEHTVTDALALEPVYAAAQDVRAGSFWVGSEPLAE